MKKKQILRLCLAAGFLVAFLTWTWLLGFVDVMAIGPRGSSVGFATLNGFVHNALGVNMTLYHITDWLGLVPIAVAFGFAVFGLIQWIKRKSLLKVDRDILILGGFYLLVMAVYVIFEFVVINRRPVLIEGYLEVSYPSSTTMLVTTVMPTALIELRSRIKSRIILRTTSAIIVVFTVFMVVGRLLSGVHWASDIIGGLLISASLIEAYDFAINSV